MMLNQIDVTLTIIRVVNFVLLFLITLFVAIPIIKEPKQLGLKLVDLEILRLTLGLMILGIFVNGYDIVQPQGELFLLLTLLVEWCIAAVNLLFLIKNRNKFNHVIK